jgi:hypothetical protein
MSRPLWIGTSWKINKALAEARHYAHALVASGANVEAIKDVEAKYNRM